MTFEYRVEEGPLLAKAKFVTDWLNEIARDGWQLVWILNGLFIFERESIGCDLPIIVRKMRING